MEIRLPPNYGKAYIKSFQHIFPAISEDLNVHLMPFYSRRLQETHLSIRKTEYTPRKQDMCSSQTRFIEHIKVENYGNRIIAERLYQLRVVWHDEQMDLEIEK